MKCANCDRRAKFLDDPPGMEPVYYCSADLPPHLQMQADMGMLDIPADPEERPEIDESIQESRKARRKS